MRLSKREASGTNALARAVILAICGISLAACASAPRPASVKGGECKVFPRPPTVVVGQTPYDQGWIDDTIESGVASCGWQRPAPRAGTAK